MITKQQAIEAIEKRVEKLEGSEKQIKYAECIRAKTIPDWEDVLRKKIEKDTLRFSSTSKYLKELNIYKNSDSGKIIEVYNSDDE